jgi:hypothetical protein
MTRSAAGKRPRLVTVSDEMAHRCSLLAGELLRWPEVSARPMFGLQAFYRGGVVFAMLPGKRALENPEAFAYKFANNSGKREGEKWRLFELKDEQHIDRSLALLDQAYRQAGGRGKKDSSNSLP